MIKAVYMGTISPWRRREPSFGAPLPLHYSDFPLDSGPNRQDLL